jgi:dienelactone hydrolase
MDLKKVTLREETIDDALAAVRKLRESGPLIDAARVFVLGHSLGGVALPRIAREELRLHRGASAGGEQAQLKLGGLVFMAASARPLEDLIVEQLTYIAGLDGTVSAEEKTQIEAAHAAAAILKSPELSPETPAAKLPFGVPAPYWLDLRAHDPLKIAAALPEGTRMLFLQGGRDYQVTVKDLELWRSALAAREKTGAARFVIYPKGNHLLADGEGRCEPAEYLRPAFVAAAVIEEIARFVVGP